MTCGAQRRAAIGETVERSFSTAFFIRAFLGGDKARAAEMGVQLTPADVAVVAAATPFVVGRLLAVQGLSKIGPLEGPVDAYVTWALRQRLKAYGHPEFQTDAATYAHAHA